MTRVRDIKITELSGFRGGDMKTEVTLKNDDYCPGCGTGGPDGCPLCGRVVPDPAFSVAEIGSVRELNDWLDDPQGDTANVPEAQALIAAAWYVTEDFIRRETGKCSSTHTRKDEHEPESGPAFTCQCCRYFRSLDTPRTQAIRRHL